MKVEPRVRLTYQEPRLLVCLRELLERWELAHGMWQHGGWPVGRTVAERGGGHGALGGTGGGAVCVGDGRSWDRRWVARKGGVGRRGRWVGVVGGRGSKGVVGGLGVEVVGVGRWGVVSVDHGKQPAARGGSRLACARGRTADFIGGDWN